ncbi:MAG: DMT family transporter [Rhodospirillaceae bacterium]
MNSVYLFFSVLAGAILPLQAALNSGLAGRTTGPLFSTFINFSSGLVAIILALIVFRVPLPSFSTSISIPWFYWCGGLLGAFFVITTMMSAPKLGASLMIAVIIAGQIGASLAFDHFGWLGYPVHEFNLGRMAGAACLIAGVYLVFRY